MKVSGLKGRYIQSITFGDSDVLNAGLHVTGAANTFLEITLGTNPGIIEGRALNRQGEPAVSVTVTLLPEAARRNRTDLYKTTQTDTLGRFQLQDIAPGDYKLYAWAEVEPGAWQDAGFMREYETSGNSLRVTEGSKQTVDLTVIPPRIF